MRRQRKAGPLRWSREEWLMALPVIGGRAYGFIWNSVSRELVFVWGCRLVACSCSGQPLTFSGGRHACLKFTPTR